MLEHRQLALDQLEEGDGELLIEWSAPRDSAVDDARLVAAGLAALDAAAADG